MPLKRSPVIVIERELLSSKAYLSLKGFAPQLLFLFYCRRRLEKKGRKGKEKWVCVNASEIEFTYSEAKKKFGIGSQRFTRAVDELISKGFINIVHQGGCYRRDRTIYELSQRWRQFGKADFKEAIRPGDPVKRGFRRPK